MDYISTRGYEKRYRSAEAVLQGVAPDGGLLVPAQIPKLSVEDQDRLLDAPYPERVAQILHYFLPDFTYHELLEAANLAYSEVNFGETGAAKLVQLNPYNDYEFMLELWHGPSFAFKDYGLQLLPHLMRLALEKLGDEKRLLILTATSGDTGSAALSGFANVEGTEVVCLYPDGQVSRVQELQMTTTTASNVEVLAVEGNFDEAQAAVKACFANEKLLDDLDQAGIHLSSANSINWGRLVAQIAYYWSAYFDLVAQEKIEWNTPVNFVVPTGNFGNILAAWYAREMGLPVGKLICASNRNNVLSDFFRTGNYSIKRALYSTNSPSMDILISSNLERLLFHMSGQNAAYIQNLMKDLTLKGDYFVGQGMRKALQSIFVGGFSDDRGIERTILDVYDDTDHVVDPHTAVAFNVYARYQRRSHDTNIVVYVSTASPYKFVRTVSEAIFPERLDEATEFELFDRLQVESDLELPETLAKLEKAAVVHDARLAPTDLDQHLLRKITAEEELG